MKKMLDEIKAIVDKYGWRDRKVTPYGFSVPVSELIERGERADEFDYGSRVIIKAELKGLLDVVREWERIHNNSIEVIVNGKTVRLERELAEVMIAEGSAREVVRND